MLKYIRNVLLVIIFIVIIAELNGITIGRAALWYVQTIVYASARQ